MVPEDVAENAPEKAAENASGRLVVRGTEICADDPARIRRQKLARITLDSMVQFVGLLDAQGTVLEINQVALDAVGITLADVEGKPFWTTFWWQVSEQVNRTLRDAIARAAQGELVRWDTPIFGRAGGKETIIIDASFSPVKDARGKVVFICAEGRDITEKKAQERLIAQQSEQAELAHQQMSRLRDAAESASRAKDEFLAMLGHELRNPLSPILTALQLMKLRGGDSSERERIVIERQVNHLTRLVDDLLDVSRIARGRVELQRQPIELSEIVARALEMASPLIEERSHHVAVDVARRGLRVEGDPIRLGQVISNLLTNAAKYTPPGGDIRVAAQAAGGEVVLSVRDSGIGIAPDVLPRVFDLFVQEQQALDRSRGGLGLGLTIVRNLVERHGGTVSARSDGPGHGSEFIVRLPAASTASVEAAARASSSPRRRPLEASARAQASGVDSAAGARKLRVLVVDDNEDGAEMLAATLEVMGYQTAVAHDAPAALRIAAEFLPEVGLLDIGLPVMDGYELAAHLRAMPQLVRLHLIALTGYGQAEDRRRTREAGFDHHLVKPVDMAAIEAAIQLRAHGEPG